MSATALTQTERRSIGQRGWRLYWRLSLAEREPQFAEALGDALRARRYAEAARHLAEWDAMESATRPRPPLTLVWRNDAPVSVFESERFKQASARMQRAQASLDETLAHLNDE